MNKKVIITYGTFDILHIGHINLLKRARDLGDYLIVALSSDEFNQQKNKISYYPFEERKIMLESIKYVDLVISESSWEQKIVDIKKYDVDTFVIGDDWRGKFDYLKKHCNVVYLARTPNVSTTKLKKEIFKHK